MKGKEIADYIIAKERKRKLDLVAMTEEERIMKEIDDEEHLHTIKQYAVQCNNEELYNFI